MSSDCLRDAAVRAGVPGAPLSVVSEDYDEDTLLRDPHEAEMPDDPRVQGDNVAAAPAIGPQDTADVGGDVTPQAPVRDVTFAASSVAPAMTPQVTAASPMAMRADLEDLLQAYLEVPPYCRDVRVLEDPSPLFAKLRLQYRAPPLPGDARIHLASAEGDVGPVSTLAQLTSWVSGRMEPATRGQDTRTPTRHHVAFCPAGSEGDQGFHSPRSLSDTSESGKSVGGQDGRPKLLRGTEAIDEASPTPRSFWCPDCHADIRRSKRVTLRYHL